MYRDIPEELRALIEPVVEEAGFELVDAQLARGGKPWTLKVTIDTPKCDGRVPVGGCATVSRELGSQLDVADAIEAAYRLEVSSPGTRSPARAGKGFCVCVRQRGADRNPTADCGAAAISRCPAAF